LADLKMDTLARQLLSEQVRWCRLCSCCWL